MENVSDPGRVRGEHERRQQAYHQVEEYDVHRHLAPFCRLAWHEVVGAHRNLQVEHIQERRQNLEQLFVRSEFISVEDTDYDERRKERERKRQKIRSGQPCGAFDKAFLGWNLSHYHNLLNGAYGTYRTSVYPHESYEPHSMRNTALIRRALFFNSSNPLRLWAKWALSHSA